MPFDSRKLRRMIKKSGRPVSRIAIDAGFTPGQLFWLIEKNKTRDPRVSTVEAYARTLNCRIDDLVSEKATELA